MTQRSGVLSQVMASPATIEYIRYRVLPSYFWARSYLTTVVNSTYKDFEYHGTVAYQRIAMVDSSDMVPRTGYPRDVHRPFAHDTGVLRPWLMMRRR